MSFLVLTEDFTNPNILNQFVPNSKGGYSKAISSDIVTHLWSGNVPGLPLWSLISSLLVKSEIFANYLNQNHL